MANYTREGINLNTYELLTAEATKRTPINMQLSEGLFYADWFTQYEHSIIMNLIQSLVIKPVFFKNIHWKGYKKYYYSSDTECFEFILLDKYFKEIFKDAPYIIKDLIYNQKNNLRPGTCRYSIILACFLENSRLVMGELPIKDGRSVLHRFVEIDYLDNTYVLDIAKNIIMKKDDYYNISNFRELNTIDSNDLRAIYNFCCQNRLCDHTKIISMFGNELLDDFDKNNLIKKRNLQIPDFKDILF